MGIIPVEFYFHFFNIVVGLCVVIATLSIRNRNSLEAKRIQYKGLLGYAFPAFVIFFIGFRPVDGVFVDMTTYAEMFHRTQIETDLLLTPNDLLFSLFTRVAAQFLSVNFYFFLCTLIYTIPVIIVSKKLFGEMWPLAFLATTSSFVFYPYGVNGIRSGMAASMFLLAFISNRWYMQGLFMAISVGFHLSMVLPSVAFFAARFIRDIRIWLLFWVMCIPASLIGGANWAQVFGSLGLEDDRLAYLSTEAEEDRFRYTGFRWDFLLFSSLPIFTGLFFRFWRRFTDSSFQHIFAIYLIANGFWILVIDANFSNRFAYLSWFLMTLVVFFPLLRTRFMPDQENLFSYFLPSYFILTVAIHYLIAA